MPFAANTPAGNGRLAHDQERRGRVQFLQEHLFSVAAHGCRRFFLICWAIEYFPPGRKYSFLALRRAARISVRQKCRCGCIARIPGCLTRCLISRAGDSRLLSICTERSSIRTPECGVVAQTSIDHLRAYLRQYIPALANAPVLETRVCQYENTWNGDFLVDRHPEFENVWIAGGGSGHGFKHGPALGEYLSAANSAWRPGRTALFTLCKADRAKSGCLLEDDAAILIRPAGLLRFERIQRRCYNQKRSVRTKSSAVPPKMHVCNPPEMAR